MWALSTEVARFPRFRLATLSFVKISMCSYEKPGRPGYRDLGFRRKFSHIDTPARVTGKKLFWQNSFAFATQWPKWPNFCLESISISELCDLPLLVKLQESTKLRQTRTIHFCFLNFIPFDRAEISHMNTETIKLVPVTEPARLLGSYEEALSFLTHSRGKQIWAVREAKLTSFAGPAG